MKKTLITTIILLISLALFSQETNKNNPFEENDSKNSEFGIHAGLTTGLGLSYRYWYNDIGIQLTALPIKTEDFAFISAGVTAMYSVKKTKYVRGFIYAGNHFLLDKYGTTHNIGIGPGFSFGKNLAINIMAGYAMYDVANKQNLLPTAEIGLYFKF